jgi:hypothetical protein
MLVNFLEQASFVGSARYKEKWTHLIRSKFMFTVTKEKKVYIYIYMKNKKKHFLSDRERKC